MGLGATTYSSVTWTTGDTITEAKLDAMVANDQAYDSHASNGLLLNNDTGLYMKDSGGTNRELLNVTSGNAITLGNTNLGLMTINNVVTNSKMYRCIAERTTDQAIANTTDTKINLTSEILDVGNMHDNSTNNTRITIPTGGDGTYYLFASVIWATNVAGERMMYISRNTENVDTPFIQTRLNPTVNVPQYNISMFRDLSAGDYIQLGVYHSSGGNLNVKGRLGVLKIN